MLCTLRFYFAMYLSVYEPENVLRGEERDWCPGVYGVYLNLSPLGKFINSVSLFLTEVE